MKNENDTQNALEKKKEQEVQQSPAEEEKMVDDAFQHLLDTYLDSPHRKKVEIITKAFNFARQAHKGVRRLSGEPYIMHPIAVAQIVCEELGLGSTSISAALLHDVVEDTDYTVDDIKNIFGEKIAQIVDGLTKISGAVFGEQASAQAENIKKLLITMSEDIRVVLIKICDRLHNMRTLASQPANKKYKIAGETLYLYAPIADRLGLNKIKTELEDLSFRHEYPDSYAEIERLLAKTKDQRDELFENFTKPIRERLDKRGVTYRIKARIKTPYSIWCKMQKKKVGFKEIFDILAVRIIFKPKNEEEVKNECTYICNDIKSIYSFNKERMRDWLFQPKANGYQALHCTFMSHMGVWVEVQIRSEEMDDVAEHGFAAHWKYKDGSEITENEEELNEWLKNIKMILDNPQPNSVDLLNTFKMNLIAKQIMVFTPKGDMIIMPAGCTVLDFAYNVHTVLGNHCMGAKVNHKLVPLSHKLNSCDQVEIITSQAQRVEPSWINFVCTTKALTKIQAAIRKTNKEMQKKGEDILKAFLSSHDIELNSHILDKLCSIRELQRHESLLQAIGERTIILSDKDIEELNRKKKKIKDGNSWRKYVPFFRSGGKTESEKDKDDTHIVADNTLNKKKPIYVNENNIKGYVFHNCCHPIPGDEILGYINNQKHIEIHKRACPVADKLKASFGNRILDAKWNMHKVMLFDATIHIEGTDRKGILHDLGDLISNTFNINIRKITITTEQGIFEGNLEVGIYDLDNLHIIIENLRSIEGIKDVRHSM
ncbi:MAG: RelA/SpoT family protein [Prevotella sp.]|nr:RelA/SpoT family protein [Prevotella sp.]